MTERCKRKKAGGYEGGCRTTEGCWGSKKLIVRLYCPAAQGSGRAAVCFWRGEGPKLGFFRYHTGSKMETFCDCACAFSRRQPRYDDACCVDDGWGRE